MDSSLDIGFTGTHKGMTQAQKFTVRSLLAAYKVSSHSQGITAKFRHGLCVGSDDQAAAIAKEIGYYVIAFPGFPAKDPSDLSNRGIFTDNDEVMPAGEFLYRDKLIVNPSDIMIATPAQPYEIQRSGTWATVRYADQKQVPIFLVQPDGKIRTGPQIGLKRGRRSEAAM